jgi:hypothetical protein
MLSILSGHRRYSHVTTIRGDGVNPGLLEMAKVVSEDALRKGLLHIPEAAGTNWLDGHLDESTAALLDAAWILNTDSTVKVLYGHQEGAVVAYNPKKPGRLSHSDHTSLMAGLRLVLGVEVHAGNEHASKHGQPGRLKTLDALPPAKKPRRVRGDNGYGTDGLMSALEEREQPYLFKLKLSKNVKRHIRRLCDEADSMAVGQGWKGKAGQLALQGWNGKRRVVVLRRPLTREKMAQDDRGQLMLSFIDATRKRRKEITGYEYAVLVTNTSYEILCLGQLYRDRADAENTFDELKNQWGWGGYTTHDLHRCQLAARAVARIYTWWSLFVRLAHPEARCEAITSRPWLMTSVGRKTEHAGQTTLTLTGLHAHFEQARAALTRVSALLQGWVAETAEPLTKPSVWHRVCDHLKRILAGIAAPPPPHLLGNYANGVS